MIGRRACDQRHLPIGEDRTRGAHRTCSKKAAARSGDGDQAPASRRTRISRRQRAAIWMTSLKFNIQTISAPKCRTKRRDAALRSRVPAATGRHAYRRSQSRTHSGRATAQRKSVGSQLKPRKGERIPALLCSTPITSTTKNGALLYQTAIMDLSERKAAEAKLRASEEG